MWESFRRACSSGVAGIHPACSAPYFAFWPPAAKFTARLTASGVASLLLMSHLRLIACHHNMLGCVALSSTPTPATRLQRSVIQV